MVDDAGNQWLEVSDNGIGMDFHVLNDYFFNVGSCYYTSPEFQNMVERGKKNFHATSRFGIGFISAFMIGDWIEIITRNNFSVTGDNKRRTVRIDSRGGLAFIQESDAPMQGTTVRIRLKKDLYSTFWNNINEYLRNDVVRPRYEVNIDLPVGSFTIKPNDFYSLESDTKLFEHKGLECITINLEEWSELLSGRIFLFLYRKSDGNLSYKDSDGAVLRFDEKGFQPNRIIKKYKGNRITTDGFVMKLPSLAKILSGRYRVPIVVDVDVKGHPRVEYDVSREKIIGSSRYLIRKELHGILLKSLEHTGLFTQLDNETKLCISTEPNFYNKNVLASKGFQDRKFKLIEDEELLEKVLNLLPKTQWQIGLHKEIAQKLGISNTLSNNCIGTLIQTGRVIKTNKSSNTV